MCGVVGDMAVAGKTFLKKKRTHTQNPLSSLGIGVAAALRLGLAKTSLSSSQAGTGMSLGLCVAHSQCL